MLPTDETSGQPEARVLVVCDDPETRALLVRMLEPPFRVEALPHGPASREAIRSGHDLVLITACASGLDAPALLQAVRSLGEAAPPVLLVSRPDEESFRILGLQAGADGHVSIPCSTRELVAHVDGRLEARRARHAERLRESEEREALRVGEERLHALVHRSLDGIVVIDARGTVLEWNEGEERITGIPAAEALGLPIWEVQHRLLPRERRSAEDLGRLEENVRRGLEEGPALRRDLEEEIERPDGGRRILESILFGIRSDGDVFACAIVRDVTERRRLEEALREREALLVEAERLAGIGTWARDLRTGETTWSDEVFRILGHAPGEVEAEADRFLEAVAPADRDRIRDVIRGTAQDGITRRAEFEITTPAGERRTLDGTVELLRDTGGAPGRIIGTLQDVTERRSLEEELAEANRRKDEFLAVLSHELRNPLAPIQTSLYVLARSEPGGEQARRMQAIMERQVALLTRLVDDLLDVARITRGKIHLQIERVELGDIVRRKLEDSRPAYATAGVALEGDLPAGPVWLEADPVRIEQIVGNLLSNAVKFTPPGGRVDVRLDAEEGIAALRVRDTGVGIASGLLDLLFEPFVQGHRALDRGRGGLGLGLALVRNLAELHGGSASAASPGPGQGSEFTVHLPLSREAAPAVAARRARPAPPRRVLLVEDDADSAEALREVLALGGHEVRVALDGFEALARARDLQPDLVLCDLSLPGMDGFELARLLRADPVVGNACLVALSAHALPADIERCAEAGFDRHLAKPPAVERLEEVLAELPRAMAAPVPPGPRG